MSYNDDGGRPQRAMIQGSWQCSNCGKDITQLPFEPREGQTVTCKDCYLKTRGNNRGGGGGFRERKTFTGNWKCSDCGDPITELPFEPTGDRPLFCRNCFKKNKRY